MKKVVYSSKYPKILKVMIVSRDNRTAITAAISSRDLTKNLVRTKSSNVWAYGMDVHEAGDSEGDVVIQFKDTNGGPGDIYQYLDVPVRLYRRFISAPSKGNFFWRYIRNNFYYRKLTGNRRGVLPNAIN